MVVKRWLVTLFYKNYLKPSRHIVYPVLDPRTPHILPTQATLAHEHNTYIGWPAKLAEVDLWDVPSISSLAQYSVSYGASPGAKALSLALHGFCAI